MTPTEISAGSVAWFGAASFEDRCLGSVDVLSRERGVHEACLLLYSSNVDRDGQSGVVINRNRLLNRFDRMRSRVMLRDANAIQMTSLRRLLNNFLDDQRVFSCKSLVFDVSCLTKLHIAGLSTWVWENQHLLADIDVLIAYTSPQQYGWQLSQHRFGAQFSELIHIPLIMGVPDSSMRAKRGAVALLGHEGARLSYALFSLNVDEGFYCVAESSEISDARRLAEIENKDFLSDLNSANWKVCHVTDLDMVTLRDSLQSYVDGEPVGSRQILLPFGPKPLIVQSIMTMLDGDSPDLWISYPVVSTYSSKLTRGVGTTSFWRVDFSA
ncbi:hypothetical protein [Microbacterium neimengense]